MCLGEHGPNGVPLEFRQFGALFPQGRNGGLVGCGDRRRVRFDKRGRIFVKIKKTAQHVAVGPLFDGVRQGAVFCKAVGSCSQVVGELIDMVE